MSALVNLLLYNALARADEGSPMTIITEEVADEGEAREMVIEDPLSSHTDSERGQSPRDYKVVDPLYHLSAVFLKCIEDGDDMEEPLRILSDKLRSSDIKDQHPSGDFYQMILAAKELIDQNYYGCSTERAHRYGAFLDVLLHKLPTLPPSTVLFAKHLVSSMSRKQLI